MRTIREDTTPRYFERGDHRPPCRYRCRDMHRVAEWEAPTRTIRAYHHAVAVGALAADQVGLTNPVEQMRALLDAGYNARAFVGET